MPRPFSRLQPAIVPCSCGSKLALHSSEPWPLVEPRRARPPQVERVGQGLHHSPRRILMFRISLAIATLAATIIAHTAPAAAQDRSGAGRAPSKPAAPTAVVNINTASAAELDALPGIG